MDFHIHCGLLVIKVCHCRFISRHKCTILGEDVDMGEAVHVRGKSTEETSVRSLQLCWERKTALKDNKNKIESLKETWLESESNRT